MNKAFFTSHCGPWKPYAPFFKDGVPIYGTFGILAGPDNIPAYEVRVNELNSQQVGVLLKRWLWQNEDNPTISLEMAMDSLLERCTIPKHWFSHVAVVGDITIRSEDITDIKKLS